ncbi:MAG: CcmD family protein [Peptococcaceae bacterium]
MYYFFFAYSILWVILIIYLLTIGTRQMNLEKEVEAIKLALIKDSK